MVKRLVSSVLIMFMFVGTAVTADNDYARPTGWHWYDDPAQKQASTNTQNASPQQVMKALQQAVEVARTEAILNPTQTNVANYIRLQNYVSDLASEFAMSWKATLIQHPELDYTVVHPTSSMGRQIAEAQVTAQEAKAIEQVAKTEGFLFFYKGNDPYSVAFGELLLQFVNSYHISIIPISVDGVKLKEFPDSRLDNGQANYMHISQFPALFLVSTTTHQIKPLAFGFMTVDSLRDRILKVMTNVGVH